MKSLKSMIGRVVLWMNNLSGVVLILMMLLTVMDVILRFFKTPITGTYELVAMAGAVVIAFAIPQTSREKGHIAVDIFPEGRYVILRNVFFGFTRAMGIVLFALLSWYLFQKGNDLRSGGDVSSTLRVPYYPVAYGLSFCFLLESFELLTEILRNIRREVDNA
jgi:TRAP-type C4-dicarboxylate transport system permease small subunit